MKPTILNRNQTIPADGWYQIEVTGEHPAGEGRVQVIDAEALDAIVRNFNEEKAAAANDFAGLLVDRDHLSHDMENETAAMAWVKELAVRDGQLHARLELTSDGEAAVTGKVYKFFSTEYAKNDLEDLGEGRVRPLRLSGLAFTNRPNNRGGKPISNREDAPNGAQHLSGGQTQTKDEIQKQSMKTIAEKLGLPADADEATIVKAITDLITKVEGLEKATKEAEADAVMNRMGERIPKDARPHWREQLIANRTSAEKLLEASFPVPTAQQQERIHNRHAGTPQPVEKTDGTQGADKATQQEAAVRDIMNRSNCGYEAAFDQAMREKPELFR
jgi:hypothetical protein